MFRNRVRERGGACYRSDLVGRATGADFLTSNEGKKHRFICEEKSEQESHLEAKHGFTIFPDDLGKTWRLRQDVAHVVRARTVSDSV